MHRLLEYFIGLFVVGMLPQISFGEDFPLSQLRQVIGAEIREPDARDFALQQLKDAESCSTEKCDSIRFLLELDIPNLSKTVCEEERFAKSAIYWLLRQDLQVDDLTMFSRISIYWARKADSPMSPTETPSIRSAYFVEGFSRVFSKILKSPHEQPTSMDALNIMKWQIELLKKTQPRFADEPEALAHISNLISVLAKEIVVEETNLREEESREAIIKAQFHRLSSKDPRDHNDAIRNLLNLRDERILRGLCLDHKFVKLMLQEVALRKDLLELLPTLSAAAIEWSRRPSDPRFQGIEFSESLFYSEQFSALFASALKSNAKIPTELSPSTLTAWQIKLLQHAKRDSIEGAVDLRVIEELLIKLSNDTPSADPDDNNRGDQVDRSNKKMTPEDKNSKCGIIFKASFTSASLIERLYHARITSNPQDIEKLNLSIHASDSSSIDQQLWNGELSISSLSETALAQDFRTAGGINKGARNLSDISQISCRVSRLEHMEGEL